MSEWLDIMLGEIAGRREERQEAQEEAARRAKESTGDAGAKPGKAETGPPATQEK